MTQRAKSLRQTQEPQTDESRKAGHGLCGWEGTHDVACLGGRVHSALRHATVPGLHLLVRAVQARREQVARLVALRHILVHEKLNEEGRCKRPCSACALTEQRSPHRSVVCKRACGPRTAGTQMTPPPWSQLSAIWKLTFTDSEYVRPLLQHTAGIGLSKSAQREKPRLQAVGSGGHPKRT